MSKWIFLFNLYRRSNILPRYTWVLLKVSYDNVGLCVKIESRTNEQEYPSYLLLEGCHRLSSVREQTGECVGISLSVSLFLFRRIGNFRIRMVRNGGKTTMEPLRGNTICVSRVVVKRILVLREAHSGLWLTWRGSPRDLCTRKTVVYGSGRLSPSGGDGKLD